MKLVIIVNKKSSLPAQMNAASHICYGLALEVGMDASKARPFSDADGTEVSLLTDYPLIVFSARNSNHLREAHEMAIEKSIKSNAFFECYRSSNPDEQERQVKQSLFSEQPYIALALFGEDEKIRPLTRRFSLLKD